MSQNETVQISVVIPVYNGAQFLEPLIRNLSAQTRKNFEVVFINDGSKDESKEILDQLDPEQWGFPIRVIHQENKGVSAARNVGLYAAEGKYVCFVDVDDLIAPDYMEILYDALQTTGLRVAAGHITRDEQELYHGEPVKAQTVSSTDFLRQFLYTGIRYSVCACMFEKSCLTERQLCFPEGYRYSEDVYVLWQLFAAEKGVAEVPRKLYYYCDNPYSAMNRGIDLRRMDAITLMRQLEPIIAKLNPEFSAEFDRYVVARHHWSILWQAAGRLNTYKEFKEYSAHFEMKAELKKLFHYPESRISLSSRLYVFWPAMYYILLKCYMKISNRK